MHVSFCCDGTEDSLDVWNGALSIRAGTDTELFGELQFYQRYATRWFAKSFDSPGIFGPKAFGTTFFFLVFEKPYFVYSLM